MTVRTAQAAIYVAQCDRCGGTGPPESDRPRPPGWSTFDAHVKVMGDPEGSRWVHMDLCPGCANRIGRVIAGID